MVVWLFVMVVCYGCLFVCVCVCLFVCLFVCVCLRCFVAVCIASSLSRSNKFKLGGRRALCREALQGGTA